MKYILVCLSFLFLSVCYCQKIDSTFIQKNYISNFSIDTNNKLPIIKLLTENDATVTLDNYKGKTLYIGLWSTSCAPCIAQFPYEFQLMNRFKKLGLANSLVFLNINTEDSKLDWKKALQKYNPNGINLLNIDSAIWDKWNLDAIPCYILISRTGKLLGKYVSKPSESGTIDWLLYAAINEINPIEATWRAFTQNKIMEEKKSSEFFTDQEYTTWFRIFMPSLLEFNQWRKNHERQKKQKPLPHIQPTPK